MFKKPLVYSAGTHHPIADNELLDPTSLPLSARSGNELQLLADGLYKGSRPDHNTYYISSTGSNLPASGSKAQPMQTLDYCLSHISGGSPGYFGGEVVIALHCGQSFIMTNSLVCMGHITFTFWGDTNYGDFDSPVIGFPGTIPAVMSDLARPVLTLGVNSSIGLATIYLEKGVMETPSVVLQGIQLNLPTAGVSVGPSDFVTVQTDVRGRCSITGSIINMTDVNAKYGLFGVSARSQLSSLAQYASQFKVGGILVTDSTSTAALLARQYFIKFYPDFAGNHQSGGSFAGDATGASPGYSMIQLSWSEVASLIVTGSKTNLASYPLAADPAFGIRNYFTNLTRDNQQRPLNVLTPILF